VLLQRIRRTLDDLDRAGSRFNLLSDRGLMRIEESSRTGHQHQRSCTSTQKLLTEGKIRKDGERRATTHSAAYSDAAR
jgi:hypothetical protein